MGGSATCSHLRSIATNLPGAPHPSSYPLLGPSHPSVASCCSARERPQPCPCLCRRRLSVRPRWPSLAVWGDQVGSGGKAEVTGGSKTRDRSGRVTIRDQDNTLEISDVVD